MLIYSQNCIINKIVLSMYYYFKYVYYDAFYSGVCYEEEQNKIFTGLCGAGGCAGGGAVSPVGAVAEAAEMPVFGLWNEGLKLSHVHWAFPQTVISPTQLAGGQTLNLSAGYYVLSDEWDYVDSLVGSTLNILDGAYLNGRNNIIKGLNLNLSGNACAENIDSFEYGNLTMADNSRLYVGGRVGMTAGLPATATINGGGNELF